MNKSKARKFGEALAKENQRIWNDKYEDKNVNRNAKELAKNISKPN